MANKTQILCPYCCSWNVEQKGLESVKQKESVAEIYHCKGCNNNFKAVFELKYLKVEKLPSDYLMPKTKRSKTSEK